MSGNKSGYMFAALAAAFYGTNPIFAIPLYDLGLTPVVTLFFRYLLGLPFLLPLIYMKGEGIGLKKEQYRLTAIVGLLMALSSYALYESYVYLGASVASTLLFMYPVLTALIMCLFFREKLRLSIIVSLIVMSLGLYLLAWTGTGESLHVWGLALVFVSSITYAVYLVLVRVSSTLASIPPMKSLFWQLLFGGIAYAPLWAVSGATSPASLFSWGMLLCLAILPTVISLLCTLKAISMIGPTATAIFGALEPVTAVGLGSIFLGESLTPREFFGGALIILATLIVIINPNLERLFLRKSR